MNAPITALVWEIWQRGRRSAWVVCGIVSLCALVHLGILDKLHLTGSLRDDLAPFFGLLMVVSFLLLMGIFNYTESNPSKAWNGFPYRLFVLPLRTWQLVALPMFLSVAFAELVYFAWIELVWSSEQITRPGWFAVVLGAYVIFYQTTLWSLAGLRITRLIALSLGGVSSLAVAALPFFAKQVPSPWLSESRLIPIVILLAASSFLIAWATVTRQRGGGGHRESWVKILSGRVLDAIPRRQTDFVSPGAAQFWFEWRRTGWVLPACMFFLLAIIAPATWFFRDDPRFTNNILVRLLIAPVGLAFVIGKGFSKCEFWSTSLALPTFVGVKPLSSERFVMEKLKVAALSVSLAWLLELGFVALWLPLWANIEQVRPELFQLQMFFPHSWQLILVLSVVALLVLTWRCMVGGLWVGLSGNPGYYLGSLGLQVIVPAAVLLAAAIWSDTLDAEIQKQGARLAWLVLTLFGWLLAIGIIMKLWFAVFSWGNSTPGHTRQYLPIWLATTLVLVVLAILASPPFDEFRLAHLFILGGLLLCPLGRLGVAPFSLAKNRHR